MSPSIKEKTPVKEKKKDKEAAPIKRTASPVPPPQKSPLLKRQSSRSSMFKPSDDNDENEEMIETTSDGETQDDKTPRRSNRGEKEKAEIDKKVKTTPRSNSNTRVGEKKEKSDIVPEAEQVDEEGKKISESIISQPSVRLGKMRSLTPIKKNPADADVNDPYVFQEPDESPPKFETPLKLCLDMGDEEECISPKETAKSLTGKKEDFDKKSYEHSRTENIVRLAEEHFPGDFKMLNPLQGNEESTIECSKINTSDVIVKTEDDKDKKPILQMTDRYASLFPHLASLRAQHTEFQFTSVSTELGTSSTTISSASIISEIVESSIIKSQSDPDEKEKKDLVKIEIIPMEDKEDNETKPVKESLTPSKKNKNKKTKKVRSMRKNPSHKSREVVTDSDSDSESEDASKSKASTPGRRKTIDSDRPPPVGTLKRLKPLEIDDEASSMKRLKRRKDDDTSLMCEETIPRSPQPQTPHSPDASVSQEERSGSRLEMPFATVPQSLAGPRTGHTAGPVRSPDCSPPPTPDSDQSGEAPLTIDSSRIKEEGNKSPGESSEVDMESLSGQGKAGSDDSRLDIEFPSCIDTKRTSRGRRRQAPVKKEVEEVLVKSPETSFKRKQYSTVQYVTKHYSKV